jgi:hypothetical protein
MAGNNQRYAFGFCGERASQSGNERPNLDTDAAVKISRISALLVQYTIKQENK